MAECWPKGATVEERTTEVTGPGSKLAEKDGALSVRGKSRRPVARDTGPQPFPPLRPRKNSPHWNASVIPRSPLRPFKRLDRAVPRARAIRFIRDGGAASRAA